MGLTIDRADPGLRKHRPDGQQETYLILSDEERAKGFVRPVMYAYKHVKCGTVTTMGQALSETYARDPKFYGGTFCCWCKAHFPLQTADGPQFFWTADGTPVGSSAEEAGEWLAQNLRRETQQRAAKERLDAAGREMDAAKDVLFDLLRFEPVDGPAFADAQLRCRNAIADYSAAEKAWTTLAGDGK